MTAFQSLLEGTVRLLDGASIPFMIAGSFASTAHGLPRTTHDLDLVIDPPSLEALERFLGALTPNEYVDVDTARDAFHRRTMFNLIDATSGWKIDFILRKHRPFSREEFARRVPIHILDVAVFVATAEDTIVAKLEWSATSGGSERQRRDIAGILSVAHATLDREYIERWVRDLALEDEWKLAQQTAL